MVTAGRIGLTVDDVVGMLPAGQLVPLRYYTDTAFLVSSEDMARYQDATGGLGAWHPADKRRTSERVYRQQPEPCHNPVHDLDNDIDERPVLTLTRPPVFEPVTRTRRHSAAGKLICPGCNESRLTFGRELCQTCRVLGRKPQ